MKRLLIALLVLLTAGSLAAVNFTQDVIEFRRTDLDFTISNNAIFSMDLSPVSSYLLDFDPDIDFSTLSVTQKAETYLQISLDPDIVLNSLGTFSLDIGLDANYTSQIYFKPEATFPLGFEFRPEIDLDYSPNTGIDLEASMNLAFLGGRIVNQVYLLKASQLATSMGVTADDETLRLAAVRIAEFAEITGNISDMQVEAFAQDICSLLGVQGKELALYNNYLGINGNVTAAISGFQFQLGVNTTYDMSADNIHVDTMPSLTFSGNFGDAIWFFLYGRLSLPSVDLDLNGIIPVEFFDIEDMDAIALANLDWYFSPDMVMNLRTILFYTDFLSTGLPGPDLEIFPVLSSSIGISDAIQLEINVPISIMPTLGFDVGMVLTCDIM